MNGPSYKLKVHISQTRTNKETDGHSNFYASPHGGIRRYTYKITDHLPKLPEFLKHQSDCQGPLRAL